MSNKKVNLPENSNIFEPTSYGISPSRIPLEWRVDPPWLRLIKDERVIERITKIKLDYLNKVIDLQKQALSAEQEMLKELRAAMPAAQK